MFSERVRSLGTSLIVGRITSNSTVSAVNPQSADPRRLCPRRWALDLLSIDVIIEKTCSKRRLAVFSIFFRCLPIDRTLVGEKGPIAGSGGILCAQRWLHCPPKRNVERFIRPECTSRGQQEKKYVYKATLGKTYGLTPSMISELGAPDEYCDNPHYRSGWPASLYLVERVEAWVRDNTERLAKAKEQRARRSVSLKAAKERNRAERLREGLEWVTGFTIEMQQPMPATLLNDAHKVYPRVPHPEDITEKALHVYVRHWLTNFDDLRGRLSGDEFEGELGQLLRERVNSAIAISVLDWRQRHSGRGEIAHASLLPTWEHFFNRLVVAGEGDERSRAAASPREVVRRPTSQADTLIKGRQTARHTRRLRSARVR